MLVKHLYGDFKAVYLVWLKDNLAPDPWNGSWHYVSVPHIQRTDRKALIKKKMGEISIFLIKLTKCFWIMDPSFRCYYQRRGIMPILRSRAHTWITHEWPFLKLLNKNAHTNGTLFNIYLYKSEIKRNWFFNSWQNVFFFLSLMKQNAPRLRKTPAIWVSCPKLTFLISFEFEAN